MEHYWLRGIPGDGRWSEHKVGYVDKPAIHFTDEEIERMDGDLKLYDNPDTFGKPWVIARAEVVDRIIELQRQIVAKHREGQSDGT